MSLAVLFHKMLHLTILCFFSLSHALLKMTFILKVIYDIFLGSSVIEWLEISKIIYRLYWYIVFVWLQISE